MDLTDTQREVVGFLASAGSGHVGRRWAGAVAGLSRRGLVERVGWDSRGYEWALTQKGRDALDSDERPAEG